MILILLLFSAKAFYLKEEKCIIDLSQDDFSIDFDDGSISITDSSFETVCTSETFVDNTFYLNIQVNPDPDGYYSISIATYSDELFNLDVTLESTDASIQNINFIFEETDYKGITFSFHTNSQLYFTEITSDITIKVDSTNDNHLLAQILPLEKRTHIVVCYDSDECSKQNDFSIQTDQNYLSLINDDNIESLTSALLSDLTIQAFQIIFDDKTASIDFPNLPMNQIQKIELVGLSKESPPKITIAEGRETNLIHEWVIENVQLITNFEFSFDNFFIKDTENVFSDPSKVHITTSHEYIKTDSSISPFQSITGIDLSIFEIFPDIENNGDITFLVQSDAISVTDNAEGQIAIIPNLESNKRCIYFHDEKNSNNKKIFIKPYSTANKPLNLAVKNCDPIPIVFSDWSDSKYSDFKFELFSESSKDLTIERVNSPSIKYVHSDLQQTKIFDEYPITSTKFVFCLMSDICEKSEYSGEGVFQMPIEGDKTTIVSNLYSKLQEISTENIEYFILVFKSENDGIELDLGQFLTGTKLNKIGFVNDDNSFISVSLKNMPSTQNNFWEIKNCLVNVQTVQDKSYTIKELLSIDCGKIEGEGITITKSNFIENVDLSLSDSKIIVTENEMEYMNSIIKQTDEIKFIVKNGSPSSNSLVFERKETASKTCNVNINLAGFDENNMNIPISFSSNFEQLEIENIGSIKIDVETTEHIIFKSIPNKLLIEVYNKEEEPKLLARIPSENSHEKISLCYESDECSKQQTFSIENDEIFISSKTEEEFISLMKQFNNKEYRYLKLFLIKRSEDYEVKFQMIPLAKISQIQLFGFKTNYYNPLILLTEETETKDIKYLYINNVQFNQVKGSTKTFNFNDLTVNSTGSVFPDIYVHDNSNINIDVARINCKADYILTGLARVKGRVNKLVLVIFPDFEADDYRLLLRASTIHFDAKKDAEFGPYSLSDPPSTNIFFLVKGSTNSNDKKFIIIRRREFSLLSIANVIFDDLPYVVPVQYECDDSEENKHFVYNISTLNNNEIPVNQSTCNDVETYINGQLIVESSDSSFYSDFSPQISDSIEPSETDFNPQISESFESESETPSRSPIPSDDDQPVIDYESSASSFSLTNNGFLEESKETQVDKNFVNKINFKEKKITITENEPFGSVNPLYFSALNPDSIITIDSKVSTSNIGITTENSPTVQLSKAENSLSFINNNTEGGEITLSVSDDSINKLNLNEMNNKKGTFSLFVNENIKSVSFSSLIMSFTSSFYISKLNREQQNALRLTSDEKEVEIQVREKMNITSKSESTINNVNLIGQMFIYDDSQLNVESDFNFSPSSSIELVIENQPKKNSIPIITVGGKLNSVPSKVTIISNRNRIDFSDLRMIQASDFDEQKCKNWQNLFHFADGKEGEIKVNCIQSGADGYAIVLSAKEKEDKNNKLSAGAIAGIAIACVAVVAIIVVIVAILIRRKNNKSNKPVPIEDDEANAL